MKHLFLLLVLLVTPVFRPAAAPLLPQGVVREAILAAQANQLEEFLHLVDIVAIQTHRVDAMSAQQCVSILKKLDVQALAFEKWERDPNLKMGQKFDLMMTGPVRIKFVMLCTGFPDGSPSFKISGLKKLERPAPG